MFFNVYNFFTIRVLSISKKVYFCTLKKSKQKKHIKK